MIAIIDSGLANFASVQFACQRLGQETQVTADAEIIKKASHVIFPGVGTANAAMQSLTDKQLIEVIKLLTQPVLGICLGMQLLYEYCEEGDVATLGIIPGNVQALPKQDKLTLPHIGWNTVNICQPNPLTVNLDDNTRMYFVHSFAADVGTTSVAVTDYGKPFTAICQQDNFFATQFHPEKSGIAGAKLLANFLEL